MEKQKLVPEYAPPAKAEGGSVPAWAAVSLFFPILAWWEATQGFAPLNISSTYWDNLFGVKVAIAIKFAINFIFALLGLFCAIKGFRDSRRLNVWTGMVAAVLGGIFSGMVVVVVCRAILPPYFGYF